MNTVISGIGVVSAAGQDLSSTLQTFGGGQRATGAVSLFDTSLSYPVFEAPGIDEYAAHSRTLSLLLNAVDQALADAHLTGNIKKKNVGVCIGTTVACQLNDLDFYTAYKTNQPFSMDAVDRYLVSNPAQAVKSMNELTGPAFTVTNACASGADAIGLGLSWLRGGICDIVIAGGADELNLVPYCGFGSLQILSDDPCMPFDQERSGLNLGEGAGILILETEAAARDRGLSPDLFLSGYGSCADAYHLTAPRPDGTGLSTAITKAMQEADISASDISFINAHGTGTKDNDRVEGQTFAKMFGANLPFLSTKGFTGHTLGAAGAIEAVFTVAALREGWIPASPGFCNPDPEIGVTPVTTRTAITGSYALSTSLAFGGSNSALIFGKGKSGPCT